MKRTKPKKTPAQILASMIEAAMAIQKVNGQELARRVRTSANTVYSDLNDPDRIPQNRLWLYFTVLDIDCTDTLQAVADRFSATIIQR